MAIDAERLGRLDSFLTTVSPAVAARLAMAVEIDRARGGALPHDRILEILRPKLREADGRLNRVPTTRRLVCEAFEDLLISGERSAKIQGRISRANIDRIWTWLTETLVPDAWLKLDEGVVTRLMNGAADFVAPDIAAFQVQAAEAILSICPTPDAATPDALVAAEQLGGADVLADAYDIARMLEIAAIVLPLQQELGRPIATLNAEALGAIKEVWEGLIAAHPEAAPYLVFMIMGRLAKPWEIMRLSGALSHKVDDALISHAGVGQAGALLLADIEAAADSLRTMRPQDLDFDRMAQAVELFSLVSTGIVRELGLRRDGGWGKRLMAARIVVADAVDRLLPRAVKDITATLPMARRATFTLRGRRLPDLTKKLDPVRAARALGFARLIVALRPHAAAGSYMATLQSVDGKCCNAVTRYTAELVDELLAIAPTMWRQAADYVAHAATLSDLLLGAGAGDIVRRRCASAIAVWENEQMVA